MDQQCLFKVGSTAERERLGLIVPQDTELQEIQAGTEGLESYDCVPDDDIVSTKQM